MNLVGAVTAVTFDATQPCGRRTSEFHPGCGTVLVLGSGGHELWQRFCALRGGRSPRPSPLRHPLHAYSSGLARQLLAELRSNGSPGRAVFPDDRRSLNFQQLAEAAGFGTVSPVIGLLLHPDYGPWVSLRAALLLEGEPFGPLPDSSLDGFAPCNDCSRPCVRACPIGVHDRRGSPDLFACASHRHDGNCAGGCDVRRACPVGAQHRYDPAEEQFRHTYALYSMRRYYGLGLWKLVPSVWRR